MRAVLVLSLMTTGCALYVRPITSLTPDDHVVLELNDQGIPDMAPRLGSGTFLVGGTVQSIDSTSLVMAVYRTQSTHAILDHTYPSHWGGETVAVPKFDVASARVERVSVPLAIAVGAALIATGVTTAEIVSHAHLKPPTLPPIQTPPNPFPGPVPLRAWPGL